jgi:hypothetical protein
MRSLAAASLGVASLLAAACAGDTEPEVAIGSVSPAAAYNQEKVSIVIAGGPFRPVYDIDTRAGRASMELGSFTGFIAPRLQLDDSRPFDEVLWVSATELLGGLPREVPAGTYDVFIRDPRGHIARLDGGFTSLGPDGDAPVVTIIQPPKGTIVLGGAQVPVAVLVSDGMGRLKSIRWTAATGDTPPRSGVCPVPPMTSEAMCRFTVPTAEPAQPGQPLVISITATDWADNDGRGMTTLALSDAPTVTRVSPLEGPAVGGTHITVTGTSFVSGTQLLVDGVVVPLLSNDDPQTLTAKMPAHAPGFVTVSVRAGSAEVRAPSQFRFVGTPVVLAVSPPAGPVTGGQPVAIVGKYFREGATTISFATTDGEVELPLLCPRLVSPSRIEGITPRGTGAMSVIARDPVGGSVVGEVDWQPVLFTFLELDNPDVAPPPPPPICEGGML